MEDNTDTARKLRTTNELIKLLQQNPEILSPIIAPNTDWLFTDESDIWTDTMTSTLPTTPQSAQGSATAAQTRAPLPDNPQTQAHPSETLKTAGNGITFHSFDELAEIDPKVWVAMNRSILGIRVGEEKLTNIADEETALELEQSEGYGVW